MFQEVDIAKVQSFGACTLRDGLVENLNGSIRVIALVSQVPGILYHNVSHLIRLILIER